MRILCLMLMFLLTLGCTSIKNICTEFEYSQEIKAVVIEILQDRFSGDYLHFNFNNPTIFHGEKGYVEIIVASTVKVKGREFGFEPSISFVFSCETKQLDHVYEFI
ncbi:hypothetical protein QSV34_14760 [Porticoccus sp. W117]|uniref:hypothetical protein n=1 Tax=Porticoccus sp. W117 TaxID=3054777 RepID=UPI00259A3F9D|nr:hypothetical protein [Porticoccus sp. W117]MDM3872612.1 hypothetical protein [Porticoccus sp. W117]